MFGFIGRRVKKTGKTFARWADVSLMKRTFYFIRDIFTSIFRRNKEVLPNESFSQAIERMQLSDADLITRAKIFKVQILIYALGAIMIAVYVAYLINDSHWISAGMSMLVMLLLVINALKSHFWLFQLKQRKLGCTLGEWLNSSIKESK